MDIGGKNRCATCNEELLGRDEVEAYVRGEKHVYMAREHMMWTTYLSGNSFIYMKSMARADGGKGIKNVVCGCNVQRADTPSMTMILPEFRDRIREVFGDTLSVPLLFSFPAEMIAWENAGLVRMRSMKHGLTVANEGGMSIIDVVADMSRHGMFDGSALIKYGVDEVLSGFSYLHMIKPRYRSFVAADLGPNVPLSKIMSTVNTRWFDWERMLTLKVETVGDGGAFKLSGIVGLPLVGELARVFSQGKGRTGSVVRGGVHVAANNTCVQFMPADAFDDGDHFWCDSDAFSDVLLQEGDAFVPAGLVRLNGYKLAVTFEPGVRVKTKRGTIISAPSGAVSIFLDGTIEVDLLPADNHGDVMKNAYTAHGDTALHYQVSLVCESYATDTALGKWYAKRFDVLSTSARFYQAHAEILLLSSFRVDKSGASDLLAGVSSAFDEIKHGVGLLRIDKIDVSSDTVYTLPRRALILGGYVQCTKRVRVVVNDAIDYGADAAIGLIAGAVIRFSMQDRNDQVLLDCSINDRCDYFVQLQTPEDAYVIDGGGPSDSEGYCDETATASDSVTALHVLIRQKLYHQQGWALRYAQTNYGDLWYTDVGGLGYTYIAKHGPTLAHVLGVNPSFYQLLQVDAYYIDFDLLSTSGWCYDNDKWKLVTGRKYDLTWAALIQVAVSWYRPAYGGKTTLFDWLCDEFGLSETFSVNMFHVSE